MRYLVAGGGGFIGGHLVGFLLDKGHEVVSADIKPVSDWQQFHNHSENHSVDFREFDTCKKMLRKVDVVINLAADMGGMGFIELNKAACMVSVLINTNLLRASKERGISKYFFASSACVYSAEKQKKPIRSGLKEEDIYPIDPEDGYGWEKLFSERMCRHFAEDFGLPVSIGRFHNVYGPYGTFEGGREKVIAALCRKVATAALEGDYTIEVWGDGNQTRSFTYVTDAVQGVHRLMATDYQEPLNIGSDETVSINELVNVILDIADVKLTLKHQNAAPLGVRGRSSDNSRILEVLGWKPKVSLEEGVAATYAWVLDQLKLRTRRR